MSTVISFVHQGNTPYPLTEEFKAVSLEGCNTWDNNSLKGLRDKHGVELISLNNPGDLVFEDRESGDLYYAKTPKNSNEALKEYLFEVGTSVCYQYAGISCPERYIPTFDSDNTFRIASLLDKAYYHNFRTHGEFSDWSQEGIVQLKWDWVARQYFKDSDANTGRICYNPKKGLPKFIDFASTGQENVNTGCYGREFIRSYEDPDLIICIERLKSLPLDLIRASLMSAIGVIGHKQEAQERRQDLEKIVSDRIEFHRFRKKQIEEEIKKIFI